MSQRQVKSMKRMVKRNQGKMTKHIAMVINENQLKIIDEFVEIVYGYPFKSKLYFCWHVLTTRPKKKEDNTVNIGARG